MKTIKQIKIELIRLNGLWEKKKAMNENNKGWRAGVSDALEWVMTDDKYIV